MSPADRLSAILASTHTLLTLTSEQINTLDADALEKADGLLWDLVVEATEAGAA